MRISRAGFIKICGIALLNPGRYFASTETFTADWFRPHVATPFQIQSRPGIGGRLTLAKLTERPVSRNVAQFSLLFHGAPDLDMTDGSYRLRHPVLGVLDLFVVRVGSADPLRSVYQACFSRRV